MLGCFHPEHVHIRPNHGLKQPSMSSKQAIISIIAQITSTSMTSSSLIINHPQSLLHKSFKWVRRYDVRTLTSKNYSRDFHRNPARSTFFCQCHTDPLLQNRCWVLWCNILTVAILFTAWEYVNADFTLFQSNVKALLETNLWMEARPTLTRPKRSIMCSK